MMIINYMWSIYYLDMHCKPTFIPDNIISWFTADKLVFNDKFLRVSFKQTCVVITIIRQGLVSARNIHNDGALANLKIFSRSQIYKSWFTVFTVVWLLFICIKLIYLNLTTTESFFLLFLTLLNIYFHASS